jgi:dipeptidyl aminopeptidase/acylaminoacyl peptidase
MITLLVLILMLIIMIVLVTAYLTGNRMISRRRPDPPAIPTQYGLNYETAFFESRDGLHLEGWWIPAQEKTTRTVIQCHGQNGSMDPDLIHARMLHNAGFNVLMFNSRAHGGSGGSYVTFGLHEKDDLLGAIDYVQRTHKGGRVGVIGFSMGAMVALHTATDTDAIACIVADGTTGSIKVTMAQWLMGKGLPAWLAHLFVWLSLRFASLSSGVNLAKADAARWIPRIENCPILFIHGERDQFVSTKTIRRMAKSAKTTTDVWIVPECRHREADKRHPETYQERVTAWFNRHLTENVL